MQSVVSAHIKARSSFVHEVDVDNDGQLVRWHWKLDHYDIAFTLTFLPSSPPPPASSPSPPPGPSSRVSPAPGSSPSPAPPVVVHDSQEPVDSSHPLASSSYLHTSAQPGKLVFHFSNAHSTFRSKHLMLTITSFPSAPIPLGSTLTTPLGTATVLARLPSSMYWCSLPYGTASLSSSFLLPWYKPPPQPESPSSVKSRTMVGVWLFFTNHLEESEAFFRSEMDEQVAFSLSYACVGFLRALMTWEKDDMAEAHSRINAARTAVAPALPPESKLSSITRLWSAAPALTNDQLEATLITAETLILQALLLLVDEHVMSIVQAGLRIRSSHRLFDRCWHELQRRQKAHDDGTAELDPVDPHVLGGIQNGLGTFNVMLSLLPPIMLRLLSFLGFTSNRSQGLAMLHASAASNGLRSALSSLVLLFLHAVIPSFFTAHMPYHVAQSTALLSQCFRAYPKGSWFLWMQGRQQRNNRQLLLSTQSFLQAADGQRDWRQLQHLCAYELGVSYAFMLRWDAADEWWRLLERENQWSKGFYAYMQCVVLMERVQQHDRDGQEQKSAASGGDEQRHSERGVINDKLDRVVVYCERKFGGKQLSLEQFILQRCEEWKRGRRLMLPTLEVIFLYHGFACMEPQLLIACLERVETELDSSPYWSPATATSSTHALSSSSASLSSATAGMSMSNHCLLLLLLAALLKQLARPQPALAHLQFILSHSHLTTADPYLTPFAQFELATIHLEQVLAGGSGDGVSAEAVREEYRLASSWKGHYHFKNRLHLRIHLAVTELKRWQAGGRDQDVEGSVGVEGEGEDSMEQLTDTERSIMDAVNTDDSDHKTAP